MLRVLAGMVALFAVPAGYADTFLVSSFDQLYRVKDGAQELFDMPVAIRGLHRDHASGDIYAMGDPGNPAPDTLYRLDNGETGTPTLTPLANLSRPYGGFTAIGDRFYGFDQGALYEIDVSVPGSPVETFIGDTGVERTGGAAYDPVSGTLYVASATSNALYVVDPTDASVVQIGAFGTTAMSLGAEWFNGQLYLAVQSDVRNQLEVGRLDASTGQYTLDFAVAPGADDVATALTVIPEPATLAMLLLLSAAARRARN